jgi:hypothetical protein
MHPTGQEQFQPVQPAPQTWVGDLPSGDPTDWFASSDEYYAFVGYNPDDDEDEPLIGERLIDE